MVCLESSEPHIRVIWGTQFVTPSFAQPTPKDGNRNILASEREIRLGLLPAMVVVQSEWLTPADVAVLQAADMEALLARLAPRHPHLSPETPRTERISVPRASLALSP